MSKHGTLCDRCGSSEGWNDGREGDVCGEFTCNGTMVPAARARLIAAAPTLLEALKTFVKLAGPAAVTPEAIACNAAAVAAIEAAEGGEG